MSSVKPLRRLLVANRGEIASRIIRSAHQMGIATVAVFADADAHAAFVRDAHQAVSLRGATPAESYLDMAKILDAARRTGADAVHPGYGFLAENASFAQAVIDAGLTWVGPSPSAIASMGDKLAAKELMKAAGVPMLPSVEVTAELDLASAAESIGFPVLVKAAAGGGGKGMRVVRSGVELDDAVAGAQREAESAFGHGVVFLEKYLPAPRHIEIQVMGDEHGTLVHLFERECSIQRRHQKIIEEAPSPVLTPSLRDAMGEAALTAARSINYSSAGTVEFLLDGDGDDATFYFLEVNTRIQVEHPVTEEITGIDLVREQLLVAMGAPLSFGQHDLAIDGHAIEARLYAEDPAQGFLPAIGTLHGFEIPASPTARVDTGVEKGTVVGVDFDPMLAKVIVHAPTRTEAAGRLALVLESMTIAGVRTNRDFLVATLRHDAFLAGDTKTDFTERHQPQTSFEPEVTDLAMAAQIATMFEVDHQRNDATQLRFMRRGYRNSSMPAEQCEFDHDGTAVVVKYRPRRGSGFVVDTIVGDDVVSTGSDVELIGVDRTNGRVTVEINGARSTAVVAGASDLAELTVQLETQSVELVRVARFADPGAVDVAGGQVAPMPGKVLAVHVEVEDTVQAGQALVIMEAMKMEHTITAPSDSTVIELRCAPGDQVDNGYVLVVLEPLEPA